MNGPQFYETRAGRTYYEVTLPNLVQQISRLNDLLALHLELVDRQLRNPKTNGCCGGCQKKD